MAVKKRKEASPDGYQMMKQELKSGELARVYVLYGEESYLVDSCRKALRKKLVEDFASDFNLHQFDGESWDMDAFQEAVEAIPVMSETSLVEVSDVNLFTLDEHQRDRLTEIFSDMPEYCTVLFVFDTVPWKPDKRMKKLYGAFSQVAHAYEMKNQPEHVLIPWMLRELKRGQKTISDDMARYLIMQTGGSMTTLSAEIQKLLCYTDREEICRQDIDEVVIPVLEAVVFRLTDDIGSGQYDQALLRLKDLLRQDTEPIVINAVIGRQFRQMYGAKVLSERGKDAYSMMELFGISQYAAKQVYAQARRFKKSQLRAAMELSAEADLALKSFSGDREALLEELLLRLAGLMGVHRS